jgi:hypothetical protein
LEEAKRRFGANYKHVARMLRELNRHEFTDAESLIRFHETLLFLRAYPPNAKVLSQVENLLKSFVQRVSRLRQRGEDLAPLDEPEVSGIAGTTVTSNFSYDIVRGLVRRHPTQVSIDWDWFEDEERFGATMPRFLPLLEEDAMVEAHVPYREWLRRALGRGAGRSSEIGWMIKHFEALDMPAKAKAELYDSLKLHVTWKFSSRASRTRMTLPVRKVVFHDAPLIQRRHVLLAAELASPPIPIEQLSHAAGERILDRARETSAVRYRELHGFTYGDARRVLKAHPGRGVEMFVLGVPPEHRLPLRAYHAALIVKNGVPVAYFEGLSLFERMESGFNLYYTFREGETAWIYARVLRLMIQLLGVTVFSIDPYQVGHENEEGIESGAFWFYRKLGFRPVRPDLIKLTLSEERKMSADPRHRTSAGTLRKLAAGQMLFETSRSASYPKNRSRSVAHGYLGDWDRFEVRNVGLAVQRRMAREFDGDAPSLRAHSIKFVERALHLNTRQWPETELPVFENLALVLAMIPGVEQWNSNEKQLAERIVRAKARNDEARYLRLMQEHARLRAGIITIGS